ncbi:MAG: glycosyltransferase [Deltaproteobacteria bacterium]|nr:glycosyltransferase [Deltaproteobacteria bacterium]
MPASISVVIAAFNEAENLAVLVSELEPVLRDLKRDYEIIVVDDGSSDGTAERIESMQAGRPELKVRRLEGHQGKSAAWSQGFRAASKDLICTIDADLQNDPGDIPRFLHMLEADGFDLVSGWRRKREAGLFLGRIPSKIGNGLIRFLFGTRLHDQGCGFKLIRRQLCSDLHLTRGRHRLLPVLVEQRGGKVAEIEIRDRKRAHGLSKYGLKRFWDFPRDLLKLRLEQSAGAERGEDSTCRYFVQLVGGLTLLGLLLRFFEIGAESYWLDETISMLFVDRPLWEIPGYLAVKSVHPPLYFMLLHVWSALFGLSEIATRSLSAGLGAASIPFIAAIGAEVFDRRTGLFAALLLCVSPFHVFYSQEARPYALLGFLVLLAFWIYLRMSKAPSWKTYLGYTVACGCLIYTHVFGLFAVLTLNIHYLAVWLLSRDRKGPSPMVWFGLQLGLVALFAPWIGSLLGQIVDNRLFWSWIPEPSLGTIGVSFRLFGPLSPVLFAILGIVLCRLWTSTRRCVESCGSVLLWLVVPILVPFLISKLYAPIYVSKYAFQAFLMYLLLAAFGFSILARTWALKALMVLVVICLHVDLLWNIYARPQKAPWREIASFVDARAGPSDSIVFLPGYLECPFDFYSRCDAHRTQLWPEKGSGQERWTWDPDSLSETKRLLGDRARIFLLVDQSSAPEVLREVDRRSPGKLGSRLLPEHEIEEERTFLDVDVGLFEKKR